MTIGPPALGLTRVELVQELVADLVAELEAPVGLGVFAAGLSLSARLYQHLHGFRVQALEQFHQVVSGHGQLERLALVALGPADVLQEPEVFGELQTQALGPGEVLGALQRNEEVLHDPTAGIEMPRKEQRLPRAVLNAAEAERVLALPDIATPLGLRDRAMLELLYATGVRRAELSNLAVFDLDTERHALMVRQGKGRKDRMVPTGERAARWCDRYLAEARPELAAEPDGGALFLNTRGNKIHIERLGVLIGSYVRRSGVGKPGACHLFRHTVATLMLEGGADIRYVQQMLGHTSIESTQLYTRVSLRALEAVHAATHPAASDKPRSEHRGAEEGTGERGEAKPE